MHPLTLNRSRHPSRRINIEKLRDFVLSRRAEDGGFSFCKPLSSSLPETYYAVYILKSIGVEIPNREELVDFLRNNLRKEQYSIFYIFSTLKLLGEKLPDMSAFLLNRLDEVVQKVPSRDFSVEIGTTATYSFETPNILREICVLSASLKLLGRNIPDAVKNFIKRFRRNGGFGTITPNLQETYYCVFVLNDIGMKSDVISFIKQRECHIGGFTKIPNGYPPYLEDTYYALSCFSILGYRYANEKTIDYISSLQNSDGGFRRSIYGGISSLEYTYYAVASLKYLGEI